MSATCIITNCRKRAPVDEPFCSEHRDKPARRKLKPGQRYHRLTLIERAPGGRRWWVRCDCGTEKGISINGIGKYRSCGCYGEERMARAKAVAALDPREILRALVEASGPLRKWAEVPLKREQADRSVIYAETPSPVEDACTAFDAAVATARTYLGDRS